MLLRRCTQGLCLISFVLVSCALILDDLAILFAGGTLIAGILGQYLIFDRQVRDIVRSVKIQRSVSRNPVRKGTILQVDSGITVKGPDPDAGTDHRSYPLKCTACRRRYHHYGNPGSFIQDLPVQLPNHSPRSWTQDFSGVSVSVRNLFFEDTIPLTRESDREPVLSVLPTGLFAAPVSEVAEGTRDNRKVSAWSGLDIHSLREYCDGDDLRHVDWKISAKYSKIFIRKYTAPMSHPPLVIVDLPWSGAPYPEKEFSRMTSEVTGMVRHTIETYQHVSVLLISGPNILHLIREEKNIPRCILELREWMHPAERPVHFYHMPDRLDIRSHVRDSENASLQTPDPRLQAFYLSLRDRYLSILQFQRAPVFSGQVARAVSPDPDDRCVSLLTRVRGHQPYPPCGTTTADPAYPGSYPDPGCHTSGQICRPASSGSHRGSTSMNSNQLEYLFFVTLAAGVFGIAILGHSPAGYLNITLLFIFFGILYFTRTWRDRGFYLVCCGEPLVVACSIMNLWAGLFVVCMLAGIVYGTLGFIESRQDLWPFALFCGSSFLIALLIQVSNHVLLPLFVLGSITVIILAVQSVRTYQFRKKYTGD